MPDRQVVGIKISLIRPPAGCGPGSGGFADPGARVVLGYVTNLWSFRPDDPRATNLANAVRACLR